MLLPAATLQIILGAIALYSISPSAKALYFVHAIYASSLIKDATQMDNLRYALGRNAE
jgi:hypothetical protein